MKFTGNPDKDRVKLEKKLNKILLDFYEKYPAGTSVKIDHSTSSESVGGKQVFIGMRTNVSIIWRSADYHVPEK